MFTMPIDIVFEYIIPWIHHVFAKQEMRELYE